MGAVGCCCASCCMPSKLTYLISHMPDEDGVYDVCVRCVDALPHHPMSLVSPPLRPHRMGHNSYDLDLCICDVGDFYVVSIRGREGGMTLQQTHTHSVLPSPSATWW